MRSQSVPQLVCLILFVACCIVPNVPVRGGDEQPPVVGSPRSTNPRSSHDVGTDAAKPQTADPHDESDVQAEDLDSAKPAGSRIVSEPNSSKVPDVGDNTESGKSSGRETEQQDSPSEIKPRPDNRTLLIAIAGGIAGSVFTLLLGWVLLSLIRGLSQEDHGAETSPEESSAEEKKLVRRYIVAFATACVCVTVLWLALVLGTWHYWGDSTTAGVFGDTAGFTNTWFSGLAFAGVIVTLFMQMKELAFQRRELSANTAALKQGAEAQDKSQAAMHQQLQIATKTVQLQANTFLADFHYRMMESESAESIPEIREKAEHYANQAAAMLQDFPVTESAVSQPDLGIEIPTPIAKGLAFLEDVHSKAESSLSKTSRDSKDNNVASQTFNTARNRLKKWIELFGSEFGPDDRNEVSACILQINKATDVYHRRPVNTDSSKMKKAWSEYWDNAEVARDKLAATIQSIQRRHEKK